jgi:hypothetical protein
MAHVRAAPPTELFTPVRILAVAILFEALLLAGYFLATPATVSIPRYVVYPFVWINAVLWAGLHTDIPRAPRRHQLVAGGIAVGYFLLLANWAGLIGLTAVGHHPLPASSLGLHIGAGSPGWERVRFITQVFYIGFVPYRLIGYLGLAYLVYAAVLDVTGAVVSGALGLVSCISCSFPIVASLVTGVWGGSVTLMSTVYALSLDISTVAFLVSVGLLYWRPGFGRLAALTGSGTDEATAESADDS